MSGGNDDSVARLRAALHPRYGDVGQPGSTMKAATLELAFASAHAAYDLTRYQLRATYGWPAMTANFLRDTTAGVIRCMVRSAAPRAVSLLRDALRGTPRIQVVAEPMPPIEWRELRRHVTPVFRALPASTIPMTLATELTRDDGPVRIVAATDGFLLIRSIDDTLGWIDSRDVSPHAVASHVRRFTRPAPAWQAVARRYLGVPYKLGGTTRNGIDCSALAQRVYAATSGRTLPRNSVDQQRAVQNPAAIETGDLLFVRTAAATLHVGIALCEQRVTVVHASSSRGAVVEDELDRFDS